MEGGGGGDEEEGAGVGRGRRRSGREGEKRERGCARAWGQWIRERGTHSEVGWKMGRRFARVGKGARPREATRNRRRCRHVTRRMRTRVRRLQTKHAPRGYRPPTRISRRDGRTLCVSGDRQAGYRQWQRVLVRQPYGRSSAEPALQIGLAVCASHCSHIPVNTRAPVRELPSAEQRVHELLAGLTRQITAR